MKKPTVSFVIGANATGKTHFIREYFSDSGAVCLNVYDYQERAYEEAGGYHALSRRKEFQCLYQANEDLLADVTDALRRGQSVVVEHMLFKAKRRIRYINAIREAVDADIEFYVMCPDDERRDSYIKERGLSEYHKEMVKQLEFPNPAEGIDRVFEVKDDGIHLRMDEPKPELRALALKELAEEAEKMCAEEEKCRKHQELLESMHERSFWHHCEVCGKKVFCTAREALDDGWDYPPTVGKFGMLSPRTCGDCRMTDTLWWKIQQQSLPLVVESKLTEDELATWRRIKAEPESLLEE